MTFADIVVAAREALKLLAAFPARWLLLVIVFLLVVEGLMFIPYVGFVAKIALASLLVAQVLVMFSAADAGHVPRLKTLLGALSLPRSTQLVLVLCGLVPFVAGIAYLVMQGGGWGSAAFFFGNIIEKKPPAPEIFLVFKYVMYVAGAPFTFVAAAVALGGASGWNALSRGLALARANGLAVVVLVAISVIFELAVGRLAAAVPGPVGAAVSMVLLVAFVAWSFSFLYALSARALGIAKPGSPRRAVGST